MDREQLKRELQLFLDKCSELGRPIEDMCLIEAYPGVVSTSFIIEVKASWVDGFPCSEALDFLFDMLFDTTTVETRTFVFMIRVLDGASALHCISDSLKEKAEV